MRVAERVVTVSEHELEDAISDHARDEYPDEAFDYQTSEVSYQDHSCHASCASDVIDRILKAQAHQ